MATSADSLEEKALGLLEAMPTLAGDSEIKLAEIALIVAGCGFAVAAAAIARLAQAAQRKLESTIDIAREEKPDPKPPGI